MEIHTRYQALALQTSCFAVNDCSSREQARARMSTSVVRIGQQIAASKAFIGADLKLVVLPEYFLTGFPMQESMAQWRDKACLAMDDPLYAELGEIARNHHVHISGNAYELDPNFPQLYFQCGFLIDHRGALVLRYRRLVSMYAPTPHDVWQQYLQIYGLEGVFPVARTQLGRIACIASEEILYPEIARAFAFRGADVFVHNTSEVGTPLASPKSVAKLARAYENMVYVVSANSASIEGAAIPAHSTDGMSAIVDYKGLKLVEAGYGESMVAFASIDLDAQRAWRERVGMSNILARQRTELFAAQYANSIYPANTLAGISEPPARSHFLNCQRIALENLAKNQV